MSQHLEVALASVIVLGVAAQWIAWRLKLPSILLLLVVGVTVGPFSGLLVPDDLFGPSLLPLVSLSVALILYEGGLSLHLRELAKVGVVIRNLLTIGMLMGWLISAVAAYALLGLDVPVAILLGAILVVTGPTVVGPLLRHIRPVGPVASILKWEGITIDPIGALMAVLVFEVIVSDGNGSPWVHSAIALAKTIVVGGGLGLASAWVFTELLRRYWIPDELQNAASLMLVVAAFAASQAIQEESGLFTATVMGIALANQKKVEVEHIVEFKEDLRVLLIGVLFILLAARLKLDDITQIGLPSVLFVIVLIVIGRPISVWVSTIGSGLKQSERVFLAWMAPRGIVAAAVSSVFALRLEQHNYPQAGVLVSATFSVIVGTVAVYGLTGAALARRLKVADPNPQGLLIVGASAWARAVASALLARGIRVVLVDTNYSHLAAARMAGIPTYYGSILSEHVFNQLDLGGIGRVLAATPNDSVNILATQRFSPLFGRSEVYRLPPAEQATGKAKQDMHEPSRLLFEPHATYYRLGDRMTAGQIVKVTPLTETFDYEAFRQRYGQSSLLMFVINESGKLLVATPGQSLDPKPGQTVVCFVEDQE